MENAKAVESRQTGSGQLRLTELSSSKYPFDSERAKTFNRKVGMFIAKDFGPLSIVNNKHAREFVTARPKRKGKSSPSCTVRLETK